MSTHLALVVDDEPDIRELLELTLGRMNIETRSAADLKHAHALLAKERFDVCLTDMRLPDGNGIDLVRYIQQRQPNLPVAVITAFGSMDTAVEALKAGAFDFVSKPVDLNVLRNLITSVLKLSDDYHQRDRRSRDTLLGESQAMRSIRSTIEKLSRSQAPIYISGESGTGKELIARAIHQASPRRDQPFVAVNCAALSESLLESELFGHVKGAFTDAKRDKPGRFSLANKGTIFLDEIGDMSPALQVKLLRVLQDGEYEPLGGTSSVRVDVRVVAATNKDLIALVQSRQFRDDLYYRLNVVKIDLPPLSHRREYIPLLVEHFVEKFKLKTGKNLSGVSHEVMSFLMRYDFPGNVRELENIIEHAFVMCKGEIIELRHLPPELVEYAKETVVEAKEVNKPLQTAEAEVIRKALERNEGNRLRTAQELGIDRSTLWRKIKRYGIVA